MKYKAIASDIDGTLTKVGPKELPTQKVKDAIRSAEEKGLIVILATGRPFQFIQSLLDDLNLDGYSIVDNGAAIYDTKKRACVWESLLDDKTAGVMLAIAKKHQTENGIGVATSLARFDNPKEIVKDMRVRKINIRALTSKNADLLVKELEEKSKSINAVKTLSFIGNGLYDVYITSIGATKQHAIVELVKILHISTHEIIGIGDHYNDFPLLMACGLKVAMGNAVPELKAIADYIAPSVDDDGVADVIEKFVLNPA